MSHFGSGPPRDSLPSEIKLFDFEGHDVRITDLDRNPWWLLADVCGSLGIGNTTMAAAGLDEDEKSTISITEGGNLNATRIIINESGLYSLILRSRKPEAKRFKKWVTSEVLPAIRRDGAYVVAQPEDTLEVIMARGHVAAHEALERVKLEKAEAKLAEASPMVEGFKQLAGTAGMLTPRKLRGTLEVDEKAFFSEVHKTGIFYRNPCRVSLRMAAICWAAGRQKLIT